MNDIIFGTKWVDTISALDEGKAAAILICLQKGRNNRYSRHCWRFGDWRSSKDGIVSTGFILNKETRSSRKVHLRIGDLRGLVLENHTPYGKRFSLKACPSGDGIFRIPVGDSYGSDDELQKIGCSILTMVARGVRWRNKAGYTVKNPWGRPTKEEDDGSPVQGPFMFNGHVVRIVDDKRSYLSRR